MKISDLLVTYVFIKGIDKLRKKGKKKESRELTSTAERIVEIVTFICGIVGWVVVIAFFIMLFF